MSIPGVKEIEEVPPALPPPPFPFGKPPNYPDYKEPRRDDSFASLSRESSLFGSFPNSMGDQRDGPIVRVDRDEGYSSLSSTRYGTSLFYDRSLRICSLLLRPIGALSESLTSVLF